MDQRDAAERDAQALSPKIEAFGASRRVREASQHASTV
jgi:hypothetical protein